MRNNQYKNPSYTGALRLVNSWGETWKTFEDIDAQLVELGIDKICQDD
ncbi:hypothetical protein KC947_01910 [Candidatus Saccharibacteria bacterium]|nr:hypothetical protein [Candidatus Saccharibacteria bacterium]